MFIKILVRVILIGTLRRGISILSAYVDLLMGIRVTHFLIITILISLNGILVRILIGIRTSNAYGCSLMRKRVHIGLGLRYLVL